MNIDSAQPRTVFLVDDDAAVRDALGTLLRVHGFAVESFGDGRAFLERYQADLPGCLILDMAMPGMPGLEVQAELGRRRLEIPIIFLTGHATVPAVVTAFKQGAVEFLEKPVKAEVLVPCIENALRRDDARRQQAAETRESRERYERLTKREQEVMSLLVKGLSNKQVGKELAISPRTVEIHRTNVLNKMAAPSIAALVNTWHALNESQPIETSAPDNIA